MVGERQKKIQKCKIFLPLTGNQIIFSQGKESQKKQAPKVGFIYFSLVFTMLSEGAKIPLGKTAWIDLDSLTFSLYFQFLGLPTACPYLQQQRHLRGTGLGNIYQHFLTTENGSKLKPPSIRKQLKPAESKASLSSRQCWEHNGTETRACTSLSVSHPFQHQTKETH